MEQKKENFFTRLFARKKPEVEENVIVDESTVETVAQTLPHTIVSLSPEQEEKYTEKQIEEFQKKLLSFPPLRVGEINFVPFEAGTLYGGFYVKVFIRNGKELLDNFTLEEVTIGLVDANGDKAAMGTFRIPNFGTLKFGESRPWTFAWRPEQVLKAEADLSAFTITFD